jgi:FtsZ-interacting cell division protein YlmF
MADGPDWDDPDYGARLLDRLLAEQALDGTGFQQLVVFRPRALDDARLVIALLRGGTIVVLDTSGIHPELGQRVIDTACGGMAMLEAQAERVSDDVFLLAPAGVQLRRE